MGELIKMMKKIVGCVLASCIALGVSLNVNAGKYSGQDVSANTGNPDLFSGKILTSWGTTPKDYTTASVHSNTYSINSNTWRIYINNTFYRPIVKLNPRNYYNIVLMFTGGV